MTLHHTHRPELLVAELVRVTRPGGTLLVVDQLAPGRPARGGRPEPFERARDPSTTRVLADRDLRGLFDANELVLRREEIVHEPRDLESYLDLAGCAGPSASGERARPGRRGRGVRASEGVVGW